MLLKTIEDHGWPVVWGHECIHNVSLEASCSVGLFNCWVMIFVIKISILCSFDTTDCGLR